MGTQTAASMQAGRKRSRTRSPSMSSRDHMRAHRPPPLRSTRTKHTAQPARQLVRKTNTKKVPSKSSNGVNSGYGRARGVKRQGPETLQRLIRECNKQVAANPRNLNALTNRATAHRNAGNLQAALADLDVALSLDPRNPSIMAFRGKVQLDLGWFFQARKSIQGALVINPQNHGALTAKTLFAQQERACPRRVVTLRGFKRANLNISFVERRKREFCVNGFETYWSFDNKYILYYCTQEARWKGGRANDFETIRSGDGVCFIGAPPKANILEPELVKGWYEWDGSAWVTRPRAGVTSIGPVSPALRTITLAGFSRRAINTVYTERRQPKYLVSNRETYWSGDERYFLFWCKDESRWKGSVTSHLEQILGGKSTSFIGAPLGIDILSSTCPKGWYEWQSKEWVLQEGAGVSQVGPSPLLLRTVTLAGFSREACNIKFEERRSPDFLVNSRETYFASDGKWFIYWCDAETRWKACHANYLQKVQLGSSTGYLSAPVGADLTSPMLARGWHEWKNGAWHFKTFAGVCSIGCSEDHDVDDDQDVNMLAKSETFK